MQISETLQTEFWRKGIHFLSLSIAIIYANWFEKETALAFLIPMFFISLIIDKLRFLEGPVKRWFDQWFGFMMRPHEVDETSRSLSGATYVLLAAVLTIWLFPKSIAVYAFVMLIIGDAFAALVGKAFGRHKIFNMSKSWEGAAAFFITSLIAAIFITDLPWQVKLIGAYVATVTEILPMNIDDNLTIPLFAASAMFIAGVYL